jgi:predicted dithiol-disulfide oxidoreductase (DUF899 family)
MQAERKVTTEEEWVVARKGLRERERELNRLIEEVAKERQQLPWVRLDKEYTFDTEEGRRTLAELFGGRSELIVYHFMFGPEWTAGCPGCSFMADHLDGLVPHLNAHDVTIVCAAHAPLEKVAAYRRRMGWQVPFVSAFDGDFNDDFGVSFTGEEGAEYNFDPVDFDTVLEQFAGNDSIADAAASCGTDLVGYVTTEGPGLSVFALEDGVVYRTYSSYGPDFGAFEMTYNQLLDRTPRGRSDEFIVKRHDEYETA